MSFTDTYRKVLAEMADAETDALKAAALRWVVKREAELNEAVAEYAAKL